MFQHSDHNNHNELLHVSVCVEPTRHNATNPLVHLPHRFNATNPSMSLPHRDSTTYATTPEHRNKERRRHKQAHEAETATTQQQQRRNQRTTEPQTSNVKSTSTIHNPMFSQDVFKVRSATPITNQGFGRYFHTHNRRSFVFTHCHPLTVTHSLTHCQSQCSHTRDRNSNSLVAYMAIQGSTNALNPPTEPSMKLQCVAICTANLHSRTFIVETL